MRLEATWRPDLDALQFHAGNGSLCVVHRLAFRVLLGKVPKPAECLEYVRANPAVFAAAARRRLDAERETGRRSFHLNSRHIRRSISCCVPS
jgi:hypothetical protein